MQDTNTSTLFRFSEAISISIHALILLASRSDQFVKTGEIAKNLIASQDHVEKVMNILVKSGYITAKRGRNGGFKLKVDPTKTTILDAYEAIEGKLSDRIVCPFGDRYGECSCSIGHFFNNLQMQAIEFMHNTTLLEAYKDQHNESECIHD